MPCHSALCFSVELSVYLVLTSSATSDLSSLCADATKWVFIAPKLLYCQQCLKTQQRCQGLWMKTALTTFDLLLDGALDTTGTYLYPFTSLSSWCYMHIQPCSHLQEVSFSRCQKGKNRRLQSLGK